MRNATRLSARRQLDNRLKALRNTDALEPPAKGWLKAIREALGMTMAQLGARVGVSASRIAVLERAESDGRVTLKSLRRAAEALDCRLVYALVPRTSLTEMVAERAELVARQHAGIVRHHMSLEDQTVDRVEDDAQVTELTRVLAETAGSELWDE